MKPLHLFGIGLVGLGLICIAMADDTGEFGAVIELSDTGDGELLKLAMKTSLNSSVPETGTNQAALPAD